MANSLVGKMYTIDTVGYVSMMPIKVLKITLYPNTEADSVTFKYAYIGSENTDHIRATMTAKTATVSTNAITSTGNFEASELVTGDAIQITNTSSGNNMTSVFATRTDDNTATCYGVTLTDEASKTYSWRVYKGYTGATLKAAETEKGVVELDFGDGMWFPNLTCSAISSSSDLVYVHIA